MIVVRARQLMVFVHRDGEVRTKIILAELDALHMHHNAQYPEAQMHLEQCSLIQYSILYQKQTK